MKASNDISMPLLTRVMLYNWGKLQFRSTLQNASKFLIQSWVCTARMPYFYHRLRTRYSSSKKSHSCATLESISMAWRCAVLSPKTHLMDCPLWRITATLIHQSLWLYKHSQICTGQHANSSRTHFPSQSTAYPFSTRCSDNHLSHSPSAWYCIFINKCTLNDVDTIDLASWVVHKL